MVERLGLQLCDNVPLNEVRELVGVGRSDVRFDPSPTDHLTYREYPVYRVWYQNRWIENVPPLPPMQYRARLSQAARYFALILIFL